MSRIQPPRYVATRQVAGVCSDSATPLESVSINVVSESPSSGMAHVLRRGALKIDKRRGVLVADGAADALGLGNGVTAGDGAAAA